MNREHSTYHYTDIQRYVNGEMSNAEMRQMELAALNDPFLADAIEGLQKQDPSLTAQHLKEIEAHIHPEKKARIVPFWNPQLLKVAAVLLVIGGAFWLSVNLVNQKEDTLAENKTTLQKKVVKDSANNDSVRQPETANVPQEQTVQPTTTSISKNVAAAKEKLRNQQKENIQKETVEKTIAARQAANATDMELKPAPLRTTAAPAAIAESFSSNNITVNVKDEKGNPVAGATVVVDKNKTITTDKDGAFVLPAEDSSKIVSIAALGYETARKKITSGRNEIQLHSSTESLNEMVIAGTREKKRLKTLTEMRVSIDTMGVKAPTIGWKKFIADMKSALIEEDDGEKGNFIISFFVTENGFLKSIQTEQTTNETLSDITIEFLENHKVWLPSKEKIRLVIRIQ